MMLIKKKVVYLNVYFKKALKKSGLTEAKPVSTTADASVSYRKMMVLVDPSTRSLTSPLLGAHFMLQSEHART